ncbi:MAG: TM0106 family RecB-like putative nuclease, partial [Cyclobacteriaceae bacterium]
MKYNKTQLQKSASDLSNYLGCKHLSRLDLSVAMGERKAPDWQDPASAILAQRGQEHEDAYVKFIKDKGHSVVDLIGQPTEATVAAMKNGADVITQANLGNENWVGRADFLIKVPGTSRFGNWAYEIEDTKLSQETKAGTILQLSLYTDLLEQLQGFSPKNMTVVKPGNSFEKEIFLVSDFSAYYRLVKRSYEAYLNENDPQTYPYPVAHCDYCRWWKECDDKRRADDHLSLIAGMRSLQMVELEKHNITKLEQFAKAEKPLPEKPERGNKQTYVKIHNQAK